MNISKAMCLTLICAATIPIVKAQEVCRSESPVEHRDGTYNLVYDSWVEPNRLKGTFRYGRCVSVVDPTEELINHWEEVLPSGIARVKEPVISGKDYLTDDTIHGSAQLFYGNSDSVIEDATYLAHEDELVAQDEHEAVIEEYQNEIQSILNNSGEVVIENVLKVTFLVSPGDVNSAARLNLNFATLYNGSTVRYTASGSFRAYLDEFQYQDLSISFDGPRLAHAIKESSSANKISLSELNAETKELILPRVEKANFATGNARVVDADNQTIIEFRMNYLVDSEQ